MKQEIFKEARKSMLTDAYPKHYEGYDHWTKFMTTDYYKHYMPRESTIYELC